MKDDKLDKLLQEWDSQAVHQDTPANLKQKIMERVATEQPAPTQTPPGYVMISKRAVALFAAAAAIAIVCVIGYLVNTHTPAQPTPDQLAALSASDIAELRKISSEVNTLFPEGVRWISKIDNKIEIETGSPVDSQPSKSKILVRYVVLKKQDQAWKRVHLAEIVTMPGENVALKGDSSGYVWTYQAAPDVYALDSQLKIRANGTTLSLNFSGGLESSVIQNVKTVKHEGTEYRVYQTVMKI